MDELESPELRNIEMADGRVRIGRPALADSPTLLGTISESTDFYESLAVWTLAPPSTQEQRSDVLLKDHVNSDHGHGYTVQVSGVHDDEQGKGEVADSEHLATSATQSTEPLNVNSGFMTMEPVVSALAKSPTSAEGEVRNRYAGTNTDVHERASVDGMYLASEFTFGDSGRNHPLRLSKTCESPVSSMLHPSLSPSLPLETRLPVTSMAGNLVGPDSSDVRSNPVFVGYTGLQTSDAPQHPKAHNYHHTTTIQQQPVPYRSSLEELSHQRGVERPVYYTPRPHYLLSSQQELAVYFDQHQQQSGSVYDAQSEQYYSHRTSSQHVQYPAFVGYAGRKDALAYVSLPHHPELQHQDVKGYQTQSHAVGYSGMLAVDLSGYVPFTQSQPSLPATPTAHHPPYTYKRLQSQQLQYPSRIQNIQPSSFPSAPSSVLSSAVSSSASGGTSNNTPSAASSSRRDSDTMSIISNVTVSIETNQPSLSQFREIAKNSPDPAVQLDFARYLISLADTVKRSTSDLKKAKKQRILLHNEAVKVVKGLTGSSTGIGKSGVPEAQFLLAEWYGTGAAGLTIDHDKSFSLYSQATKQNHPTSTYRVAVCYEIGAGTKRDNGKAIQFYRKACALGNTAAIYKLGMILIKGGLGASVNPREGITLLKRAVSQADASTPHALYELGLLYEGCNNDDVANIIIPDLGYAFELFTKAASLGHSPSQYRLGLSYEHGLLGLSLDSRRSIAWYTKAAAQGDPNAELALSGWYLTGSDGILPQSDTDAYLWARKAADKGLAKSEFAVGYFTENGIGVRPDLVEARKWYLRAAAQGNKRSIQRLNELKVLMDQVNATKVQNLDIVSSKFEAALKLSSVRSAKDPKEKDCTIM